MNAVVKEEPLNMRIRRAQKTFLTNTKIYAGKDEAAYLLEMMATTIEISGHSQVVLSLAAPFTTKLKKHSPKVWEQIKPLWLEFLRGFNQ